MLDNTQVEGLIASFGESLKGDANIFALIDLRLPPEEQIPRKMVGSQAEGMIRNGHYHAFLVGPNSSSKESKRQVQIEKIKAMNPGFELPKSVAQQLAEAQAELEALKAAQASAKAAEKEAKEKAKAEEAAAKAAEKEAGKGGK